MMNKISAVIITFNEQRNIARCLHSLAGIADEIIVVDSGSVDDTAMICQQYGATFIHQPWLGYGEQKNWANLQAQYPFILSLDADEALSDELRETLLLLKTMPMQDAYSFNRLTNYCGQWIHHCGWYPDNKIRLWRKGVAHWSTPKVHESLKLESGIIAVRLAGDLHHYSYYSIGEHVAVSNKYSSLFAEDAHARGKRTSYLKLYVNPVYSFIRHYVFRCGFLDGHYGFVISIVIAFATFLKYSKLKQLTASAPLAHVDK